MGKKTYTLPEWANVGTKYRSDWGPGAFNTGRVFHIRGIVDGQAVVKEWSKLSQRWKYTVVHPIEFDVMGDHYKPMKK